MTARIKVQGFVCPSCDGVLRDVKDSRTMRSVDEQLGTNAVVRTRKCSDCRARHRTVEVLHQDLSKITSQNAKVWLSHPRVQAVIGQILVDEVLK